MNINMTNNAEIKRWYFSLSTEEVLEVIQKGELTVDEGGIYHFKHGELIVIANVDKKNDVTHVIAVRYSRRMEKIVRRMAKEQGIVLREAFKLLKENTKLQFEEVL